MQKSIFLSCIASVASFLITYTVIRLTLPFAHRLKLTDQSIGGYKTPLIGGPAIYIGTFFGVWILHPQIENSFLFNSILPILILGLIDDFYKLKPTSRLLVEMGVAYQILIILGSSFQDLGAIFGPNNIELGIFSMATSIFIILGLMNAINISDGLDGLAGGYILIALSPIFIILILNQETIHSAFLLLPYITALIAFLLFNLRISTKSRAQTYMGDSGSLMAGLILSILALRYSQGEHRLLPPIVMIWCVALPIMDTLTVMIHRLTKLQNPFSGGDRLHIHYRLIDSGISHRITVFLLLIYGLFLCILAWLAWLIGVTERALFITFAIWLLIHYLLQINPILMKLALKKLRQHLEPSLDTKKVLDKNQQHPYKHHLDELSQ